MLIVSLFFILFQAISNYLNFQTVLFRCLYHLVQATNYIYLLNSL